MAKTSTRKTSKTTAPKTSPPAVDHVAQAYDALDDHDRHEILSALGTSVVDMPGTAARLPFAELDATVQAAVRSARQG